MNMFGLFRRERSAPVARERLQVLLAHERAAIGKSDLVAILREEILAVIGRHVSVDPGRVKVKMNRGKAVSTLEVDIEIPSSPRNRARPPAGRTPSRGDRGAAAPSP